MPRDFVTHCDRNCRSEASWVFSDFEWSSLSHGQWGATYYGDRDNLIVIEGDGGCKTEEKALHYQPPAGGEVYLYPAAPGTETTDQRGFVEAQLVHTLGNGLGIDARAAFDAERYRGDWLYRGAGPGYDTSQQNWATGELRFRLPPVAGHKLFVGGEIQDRFRIRVQSVTPGKPIFDNAPGNPDGVPDSEAIYSAYAGDDWRISSWLLLDAALRVDDYADSFGAVLNPRVALTPDLRAGRGWAGRGGEGRVRTSRASARPRPASGRAASRRRA